MFEEKRKTQRIQSPAHTNKRGQRHIILSNVFTGRVSAAAGKDVWIGARQVETLHQRMEVQVHWHSTAAPVAHRAVS